jgi:hypothetical protein
MEDSSIVPDIKVVVWKFGGSNVGGQPGYIMTMISEAVSGSLKSFFRNIEDCNIFVTDRK